MHIICHCGRHVVGDPTSDVALHDGSEGTVQLVQYTGAMPGWSHTHCKFRVAFAFVSCCYVSTQQHPNGQGPRQPRRREQTKKESDKNQERYPYVIGRRHRCRSVLVIGH